MKISTQLPRGLLFYRFIYFYVLGVTVFNQEAVGRVFTLEVL
jgi:hypothetical protein